MNQDNYCTREYAQKLLDAGIVLETDCAWYQNSLDGWHLLQVTDFNDGLFNRRLPAPCFTEVWRELPVIVERDDVEYSLSLEKSTSCSVLHYSNQQMIKTLFRADSENPTDAAIELLIWVRGGGR
jgi:hypothetical protein